MSNQTPHERSAARTPEEIHEESKRLLRQYIADPKQNAIEIALHSYAKTLQHVKDDQSREALGDILFGFHTLLTEYVVGLSDIEFDPSAVQLPATSRIQKGSSEIRDALDRLR